MNKRQDFKTAEVWYRVSWGALTVNMRVNALARLRELACADHGLLSRVAKFEGYAGAPVEAWRLKARG